MSLFSDEAGIQLDPTIAAQWATKGCQPQLFSDSNREQVNPCGFVNAKTRDSMVQRNPKRKRTKFYILFAMGDESTPDILENLVMC